MPRGDIVDATYAAICGDVTGASVTVGLTTASNTSSQLSPGFYLLSATAGAWVRQGASGVTATNGTPSTYLPAGALIPISVVGASDDYVAGVLSTGTGTLSISPR